jgi:hypothetical protein
MGQLADRDLRCVLTRQLPHRALGQRVLSYSAVREHAPEDRSFLYPCHVQPPINLLLHPQRHRHRRRLVSLPQEIQKHPWVYRTLIEKAIEIVSPVSNRPGEERDPRTAQLRATHGQNKLNSLAKLDPLERFVFVMSVLERYSDRDCALLLGCNPTKVSPARRKALRRLADFASVLPLRGHSPTLHRLEATA